MDGSIEVLLHYIRFFRSFPATTNNRKGTFRQGLYILTLSPAKQLHS